MQIKLTFFTRAGVFEFAHDWRPQVDSLDKAMHQLRKELKNGTFPVARRWDGAILVQSGEDSPRLVLPPERVNPSLDEALNSGDGSYKP
jgi:hypothetical protein